MKYTFHIIAIALLSCSGERRDKPVNYSIATSPITLTIRNAAGESISLGDSLDIAEKKIVNRTVEFTLLSDRAPSALDYQVVTSHPHDDKAFTQGLLFHNGFLYEGTGQKGASGVRKVEISTGKILSEKYLPANIFGEGICLLNGKIYQLSWNEGIAFVISLDNLNDIRRFNYAGEGWGLTSDGQVFYRSDGSNIIHIHDTADFRELYAIEVCSDIGPVNKLNELEYIEGRIFANIWQKDEIAVINPANGMLEAIISLKGLLPSNERSGTTDVLNGIAYDGEREILFVTGKYWPKMFEIKLKTAL